MHQAKNWFCSGSERHGIPADLITNSFKCCGISNALDGTGDKAVWDEKEAGEEGADDELEKEFDTGSEEED